MNYDDFGQILKHVNVTIESKVVELESDAKLRRYKDFILFTLGAFFVICAFCYGGYLLIQNPNNHWAIVMESNIVTALLAYLTGKKVSN